MEKETYDSLAVTSQIAKLWMASLCFTMWALSQSEFRKVFSEKEKEGENTFK